jgi:hypothetical protein
MNIEAEKYYLTRDGRKVGPMKYKWDDMIEYNGEVWWRDDGSVNRTKKTPRDLVSEWIEDTPKWRDMSPEQKGSLLLAHHQREKIEYRYSTNGNWHVVTRPTWDPEAFYRVKPHGPKRETKTIYGGRVHAWNFEDYQSTHDTHAITFDMVDDEPDCSSIRMIKISEQI